MCVPTLIADAAISGLYRELVGIHENRALDLINGMTRLRSSAMSS